MLKFLLLGCGRISPNHINAIAANRPNASLVAVCDPKSELAEEAAAKYKQLTGETPAVFTDSGQAISHSGADCVSIATESGHHKDLAMATLEQGCHVLIEKPIALSTKDAKIICETARQKKLVVGVCHQNRFNPAIQQLRRAVEDGRFGKIVHATARILWSRNPAYYQQAPWRGTWAMDGGTLMNQCIHNIDLLQWMLGGEAKNIMAMTQRAIRPIEAEDFGAALVRFDNGAVGIIEGTACVYPKNLEETLSIFGEKGTVVIGGIAANKIQTWLFDSPHPQDTEVAALSGDDPINVYGGGHTPLYTDFINAVQGENQPLVSGAEGMKVMQLVLGAYKSQLEGETVSLDKLRFSIEQMIGMF